MHASAHALTAPAPNPLIHLRDLRYAWPGQAPILDIPALDISPGEHLMLHGPSGCGKSTLLALIAGLLQPSAGKLHLFGAPQPHRRRARDRLRAERMGVIFQQFNLLPYLSTEDNVLLSCRLSRARARACSGQAQAHARNLLQALDIPQALWRAPVHNLSIGQQQRVAAARALIGRPPLILADEPTSALDSHNRDRFMELLMQQTRHDNTTLIMVSHDLSLLPYFDRHLALSRHPMPTPGEATC